MGIVISLANQKGGVAKTTSCVNLGAGLAAKGFKTLLIDFDPQASLTIYFGLGKPDSPLPTVGDWVMGRKGFQDVVQGTKFGPLFVLPTTEQLKADEYIMQQNLMKGFRFLQKKVEEIRNDFDFILIDTMPTFSLLFVNSLAAADKVLIPVKLEFLSLQGLEPLAMKVRDISEDIKRIEILGLVGTFYRQGVKESDDSLSELREELPDKLLKTVINQNTALAVAAGRGLPIQYHSKNSQGYIDYTRLVEEVRKMPPENQRRSSSLALLGASFEPRSNGEELIKIPIESIRPNRDQVRHVFNDASIKELAESIEAHGLMEPIIVRKIESPTVGLLPDGGGKVYELVAGERRFRAYRFLNKPTIPAIVRLVDDKDMRVLALIENLQREDLSLIEKSLAIHELKKQLGSIERVVINLGISRSAGFLYARIGEADEKYQSFINKNNLDIRGADALISLVERVRKTADAKKMESFNHDLFENPYSASSFQDLEIRYGGKGEDSTKANLGSSHISKHEKQNFWQSKKDLGLNFRLKKGNPLTKRDQENLIKHTKSFFTTLGAKRIVVEF